MRFLVILVAAVVCASCAGVALASQPLTSASGHASVRVQSCDRDGREALFRAAMRRVPRTDRMKLRFSLLQREPGGHFERVRVKGLSRWKRSRPGVRRFAHRQHVRGLIDGSDYRARVEFRWLDEDGHTIKRRRMSSRTCSLADPLPNLRPTFIGGAFEGAGERYTVGVTNSGKAGSPQSSVRLAVDGKGQGAVAVPALSPGESTSVSLPGPRCTFRVRAAVDAEQLVTESHEGDNGLTRGCP